MKATGIPTLDHAPQVAAEWLNLLSEDLRIADKGHAYVLLRATLHAVRDFLTNDEAVHLGAQLPVLVRGLYYEGWRHPSKPVHPRGKADFISRVMGECSPVRFEDPERAVAAVFDLLRRQISEGEFNQVVNAMRRPLRELWL